MVNLTADSNGTYEWINGSILNAERTKALCIVDEDKDTLYAIAGTSNKTMETLDISSSDSSWTLLDGNHDTLEHELCCGRAMLYGEYIFLVGSQTTTSAAEIFVMDRDTQYVSSPNGLSLQFDRVGASSMIIGDILYVLSGRNVNGTGLTSWEYVCLDDNWYDSYYLVY